MAAPINIDVYSDALVVLATAGIVIPLVRHWGISPVLGYLAAGALLGPLGLGSLINTFPLLYWITVVDAKNVAGIAELGVVFLLFLIGMELSYERLKAMRRLVFGLGSLQIVFSTAAVGGIVMLTGNTPAVSIILGGCLALSSTAIVVEILSNQGRLADNRRPGQLLRTPRARSGGDIRNPALYLHSWCRRGQLRHDQPSARTIESGAGRWGDCHRWPSVSEAPFSLGRVRRRQ